MRTRWNEEIVSTLHREVVRTLEGAGLKSGQISTYEVFGSFELPCSVRILCEQDPPDAIICLGCLLKGETLHFECISQSVCDGLMRAGLEEKVPVILGILTCTTRRQAIFRASPYGQNRGRDLAEAALEMVRFKSQVRS